MEGEATLLKRTRKLLIAGGVLLLLALLAGWIEYQQHLGRVDRVDRQLLAELGGGPALDFVHATNRSGLYSPPNTLGMPMIPSYTLWEPMQMLRDGRAASRWEDFRARYATEARSKGTNGSVDQVLDAEKGRLFESLKRRTVGDDRSYGGFCCFGSPLPSTPDQARRWLMLDVYRHLESGELDEALRTAAVLLEDDWLYSYTLGSVYPNEAMGLIWEMLGHPGWTDGQLVELDQTIDRTLGPETARRYFRALGAVIREVSRNNRNSVSATPIPWSGLQDAMLLAESDTVKTLLTGCWERKKYVDWNSFTEEEAAIRQLLDEARAWQRGLDSGFMAEALASASSRPVTKRSVSSKKFLYVLPATRISAGKGSLKARETIRQLAKTMIALRRWKLDQNEFPAQLTMLVPELLEELPLDPMSGKPLCYTRPTAGNYKLYSVGPNRADDNGETQFDHENLSDSWSHGNDWIWPQAASYQDQLHDQQARFAAVTNVFSRAP